jgi:predicted nuclease of predicted toxin-antitoxin system
VKIKLDENLPTELADDLHRLGHDVHTVHDEQLTGQDDEQIFHAIMSEQRLFLTQDLDFSDIRKFSPHTHPGIVLIRLHNPDLYVLRSRLTHVFTIEPVDSWTGCFVVIGDQRVRVRRG